MQNWKDLGTNEEPAILDMAGPMMMSYPGKVAAAKIVIER